jgi:hypothetical protein
MHSIGLDTESSRKVLVTNGVMGGDACTIIASNVVNSLPSQARFTVWAIKIRFTGESLGVNPAFCEWLKFRGWTP